MKTTLTSLAGGLAAVFTLGTVAGSAAGAPQTSLAPSVPASTALDAGERAAMITTNRANVDGVKRAAVRAALRDDPRARVLVTDLSAAMRIRDKAKRVEALKALGPRVAALRADVLKRAGSTGLPTKPAITGTAAAAVGAALGPVISTTTLSSFPDPISFKNGCPDGKDRADFDGGKVQVNAASTPFDDDCVLVRGGRAASAIPIPAGAKKVRVDVTAHVDLYAAASGLGAWAGAWSRYGVRAYLPSGAAFSTAQVGSVTIPIPVYFAHIKTISADHPNGPEDLVVPADIVSFVDDIQPGDEASTAWIALPDNPGPTIQLALYVQGKVDADLTGIAQVDSDITPKSLKVTFYRN